MLPGSVSVEHTWICSWNKERLAALLKPREATTRVDSQIQESPWNLEDSQKQNAGRLIFSLLLQSLNAAWLWMFALRPPMQHQPEEMQRRLLLIETIERKP